MILFFGGNRVWTQGLTWVMAPILAISFLGTRVQIRGFVLVRQALYTWTMPLVFFALGIFPIGLCFMYGWAGLDLDLPIYAFPINGVTGVCQHAQYLIAEMESC
jgi:hypothetical protein